MSIVDSERLVAATLSEFAYRNKLNSFLTKSGCTGIDKGGSPSPSPMADKFAATGARRLKLKLLECVLTLCLHLKDDISVTDILKISKK